MNGPTTGERGFALATVLVFLAVLTTTVLYAASATRLDVQLVNNEQNEKAAFYVAEAGIAEALLRLNQGGGTNATVDGTTFDSSLAGAYEPNASRVCWKAQILFNGSPPAKVGDVVTTPTLQPAATRLAYSTATGGEESLTIGWERSDGTLPTQPCAGTESIRQIGGNDILDIVSTGQSGMARRRVIHRVAQQHLSTVVLRSDFCPGVYARRTGQVYFPGAVQVNSTCGTALSAGGSSSIVAAGSITTSGSGSSGSITPKPTLNQAQRPDPLASLPAPSLTALPRITTVTTSLAPGLYVGGLNLQANKSYTMAPGIYVMQGGGFHAPSNATVTSGQTGGVLIYNTCALPPCSASSFGANDIFDIKSQSITLYGRDTTDATYAGIVFFQDRANTRDLAIAAGAAGRIDGLLYAANAKLTMQGNADLLHAQLLVGGVDLGGNPTISAPSIWVPLGGGAGVKMISWQDF